MTNMSQSDIRSGDFERGDVCVCGHHRDDHLMSEVALVPGECKVCRDPSKCPGFARGDINERRPWR